MAKIERFEELIAWQKARELCKTVYKMTRKGAFLQDYGLSTQIQRAAVSVMSNIAEGFERGKRAEFHQYLSIAKGSCAELRSQLYIAYDVDYISDTKLSEMMALAIEVSKIIGGLRSAVEKQRDSQRQRK